MGAAVEDLVKRFHELEASQAELREHLEVLLGDEGEAKRNTNRRGRAEGKYDMMMMTGNFVNNPYQSILHQLGHALLICRPVSGEIIYWNRAAEFLYGWKSYEALNQKVTDLLVDACDHSNWESIMERACGGETWSVQFSFRKRSDELFMAMVTANPLYENGVCVGIIAVSSDASMLNNAKPDRPKSHFDEALREPTEPNLKFNRVQWSPQPQITSSVSNLAGKFLAKLNIRINGSQTSELERDAETNSAYVLGDGSLQNDQHAEISRPSEIDAKCCAPCNQGKYCPKKETVMVAYRNGSTSLEQCFITNMENSDMLQNGENLLEASPEQAKISKKNSSPKMEDCQHSKSVSALENIASSQSDSSTVDEIEPNLVADSEIRWEDLVLGEEIGQGTFGVVYHGHWIGSDVAIKVYARMDYQESALLDYKMEIAIMKKLRHPNVLLFMGAVYSLERLAIVTEYLPRGSLFKTLHKNKHALDLRRRLQMALDVVKGMNYLHRRNPPIIHRDLKSSNLLVDKAWRVKVGDFGLSSLKISTVVTTKNGIGTPQWMAPEVLRGEYSSEKSDVFSFGVILWELMTESIPWRNLNSMWSEW
ncbi:LIM domain kinase 1 isoform X2 [Phalaenopsis equestris]|uniref:LIM domain kinase 1 isoform X2 n=1 Tax=Phalaenopsis equestris TaxID=78828 RepID=UPI0009E6512B|nr:LIM domain kinase 1 isoform X2 [Phalaenopsis equestris]